MKNIIYLILILLLASCIKTNIEEKGNDETKNQAVNYGKVYIEATTDDSNGFKYFNILNESYLFGTNHKYAEQINKGDSLNVILDSLKIPQLMDVWISGDTLHHAKIFVSPGDSISFIIEKKRLKFTGNNAAMNNFFIELEKSLPKYYEIPYSGNIQSYKNRIKEAYNQRLVFFERYKELHKVPNDFSLKIMDELKFEYLNNLVIPRVKKVDNDWYTIYISDGSSLRFLVANERNREKLFDEKIYFEGLSIDDFKKTELLNNSFFKNSINPFIRDYFLKTNYLEYSREKFIAEKTFIQQNFEGDLENYAIARMIRDYHVKGFGFSTENIETLKNTMKEYDSIFSKKPSYNEKMKEIKESLEDFNFKLPTSVLRAKVLNPIGDTLTMKEVFKKTNGKVKVIDFWASWCPPCIREIKKAKKFKNDLYQKNNVEWIYLSIDKDKEKWLKKSNELRNSLNVEHQYQLLRGNKSSFSKSLKVEGIPRYVIFDGEEKIILDHAPRPSDSIIFKKIIDKINKESN